MKKVLMGIVILCMGLSVFATNKSSATDANGKTGGTGNFPADVATIKLTDTDSTDAIDTLTTNTSYSYVGPFMLCDNGSASYTTMRIMAKKGCLPAGDSIGIAYQLMASPLISDTNQVWTGAETTTTTGVTSSAISITKPANAILFRFQNMTTTRAAIGDVIWALFGKSETYFKQK